MIYNDIDYHIVFGDSAAGILRYFFYDIKKLEGKKIINISDDFSSGPLEKYETKEGEFNRLKWVDKLLSITHEDEETKKYYKERITVFKNEISNIPREKKVLIWHANNISESIGLRYLSTSLQNNGKNIYAINVSETRIKTSSFSYYNPISLAQISPEEIDLLVHNCKLLDKSLWDIYKSNWLEIKKNKHILRILENGQIKFVEDHYYDSLIINNCTFRYLKCARIVGKVLGETEQLVSDLIIDWRVRILLENKVLIGEGEFKTMRDFSIKRKIFKANKL